MRGKGAVLTAVTILALVFVASGLVSHGSSRVAGQEQPVRGQQGFGVEPASLSLTESGLAPLPATQPAVALPKSENFEGPWPNDWVLYGNPTWGPEDCNSVSPSHSGWHAAWGSGARQGCLEEYPDDQSAWMVYGPFSLSGATSARVDFYFDMLIEYGFDTFFVGASTDGNSFDGAGYTGDNGGWRNDEPFDLGPWLGQPQVWVAFVLDSDSSIGGWGTFLDDIAITTGGGPSGPPNDNFANAIPIPAIPYSNSQSTVGATAELGEPDGCEATDTTVWYKFAAPSSQSLVADTFGSNYDTVLNVYSGPASATFANLTLVDCNDDSGGLQSEVPFTATAGTTYYFQIDGFGAATGNLVFNLSGGGGGGPVNDDFDDAIPAEPQPFSYSENTAQATVAGDDPPACVPYGYTVWFEKTPDDDECVQLDTFGSDYDTVLAVYTGPRGNLNGVACNDDSGGLQSQVVFQATAGTTYHIMVGSFDGTLGGNLQFHAQPTECPSYECTLNGPTTVVAGNLPPLMVSMNEAQPPVVIPRLLPDVLRDTKEPMTRLTPPAPAANAVAGAAGAEPQPYVPPDVVGPAFEGLNYGDNWIQLAPPDPQLAVGPDHVFEMVNISGRIFNKSGGAVKDFTLRDFFALPPALDLDADPKIIYDDLSDRWFASYLASDLSTVGAVYFAVSQTSDPTGAWKVYHCDYEGVIPDYPGIGLSNDKFTVSSNLFTIPSGSYVAEQTFVVEKADIMAGLPAAEDMYTNLPYRPDRFTVRPAHSLSSVNDQYLATFDVSSGFLPATELTVIRISGTPNAGNVTQSTWNVPLVNIQDWPPLSETAGGGYIDSGDFRLLEAVWRDGHLWTSASAACQPPGDGAIRSCAHFMEVNTATQTLLQDIMFGASGQYFSWPAIRTDSDGDLYVSLTHTNSSIWAEAAVTGRRASDPINTMSGFTVLKAGEGPHCSGRWGDYMGAAVDPADPSYVWVVGEYAEELDPDCWDWGTYIARLRYGGGPPQYTLTMEASPPEGGTTVPFPGGHVYNAGTPVDLQADPAPGWCFVGWTGDPDCADGHVTVDHNMTCTANFWTDCGSLISIQPSYKEVAEGQTGTVRLLASEVPLPGLGTFRVDVTYNANVVDFVGCVGDPDDLFPGLPPVPECVLVEPGRVRAGSVRFDAGATGTFPLADITFEGKENAAGMCSELHVEVLEFLDVDDQPIPYSTQDGEMCVVEYPLGDCNCDGEVGLVDAKCVAEYAMGLTTYLCSPAAADANCDGQVGLVDAKRIAEFAMGLITELVCPV